MDEVLRITEIEAKFDSEWVLIEDPRTNKALEVRGRTVRWHGKEREEVYRKAVEIRPKRFAIVIHRQDASRHGDRLVNFRL
jgi:hypothetical protein